MVVSAADLVPRQVLVQVLALVLTISVTLISLSLSFLICKMGIKYHQMLCGEGNGNPLQYSCLENPADEGIW